MKVYNSEQYRKKFYPEKSLRSVQNRIKYNQINSRHKAVKISHTYVIIDLEGELIPHKQLEKYSVKLNKLKT